MATTLNRLGETVRGFEIRFKAIRKQDGNKVFKLPFRGCCLYDGQEAIRIMEIYTNKGYDPVAFTETMGEIESLTLKEMRETVIS